MNSTKVTQLRYALIILSLSFLLSACETTTNKAPVIEKSVERNLESQPEKTAEKKNEKPTYVVKKGDSLQSIAKETGVSVADIVAWNNIKTLKDIKVDQTLILYMPDGFVAQTKPVNLTGGVEVRNLTPINPANHKAYPLGNKQAYSLENMGRILNGQIGASATAAATTSATSATTAAVKTTTGAASTAAVAASTASTAASTASESFVWPTSGKVITGFDEQKNKGINIGGTVGQSVVSVANGKVIYAGNASRGYGNMIIVKHNDGKLTVYAHNKSNLVKEGQSVTKGQKIAEMGNTDTDTVKLHFEVRQNGKPVDPTKFLPKQ